MNGPECHNLVQFLQHSHGDLKEIDAYDWPLQSHKQRKIMTWIGQWLSHEVCTGETVVVKMFCGTIDNVNIHFSAPILGGLSTW